MRWLILLGLLVGSETVAQETMQAGGPQLMARYTILSTDSLLLPSRTGVALSEFGSAAMVSAEKRHKLFGALAGFGLGAVAGVALTEVTKRPTGEPCDRNNFLAEILGLASSGCTKYERKKSAFYIPLVTGTLAGITIGHHITTGK